MLALPDAVRPATRGARGLSSRGREEPASVLKFKLNRDGPATYLVQELQDFLRIFIQSQCNTFLIG